MSLRVVLAEDGALMRVGLTALLTRFGHQVVAEATDAAQLVQAVAAHRPDIVVTDVRMPPGFSDEGLRAAVALRKTQPGLAVLVLSQYIEKTYAGERDVLALMAEGRSNAAVARALVVSEAAVGKHIGHILTKLDLPPDDDDHRRVLAVLSFLRA